MTDSIDTSEREAEDPREPIRLPVREMRDEPVPHQPANTLRASLQLALEATPEELPSALDVLRAHLGMAEAFDHTKTVCYAAPEDLVDDGYSHSFYVHQSPPANRDDWVALRVNEASEPAAREQLAEWDIRGVLAILKCWHRLTEDEAADLVAFARRHGVGR